MADDLPDKNKRSSDVEAFLSKVALTPKRAGAAGKRGRLLFAMDATASRQPSWDTAAKIQGQMFTETANLGGLDIQLAFYRGFGEFKVSGWTDQEPELLRLMTSVHCLAGQTQIGKVLQHAVNEAKQGQLNALIFVGDSVEEDIDQLGHAAGALGLLGVPAFVFHEGMDPMAKFAFEQIAKLTGGACMRFDASSAEALRALLAAVAVFAAGGRAALEDKAKRDGGAVLQLTRQMRNSGP
ncbi:MAG: VWA domain-containing protein [Rhodospirillales bacterium]|nr:VWA domain-containing protein [Rhodospirillales bacterium]